MPPPGYMTSGAIEACLAWLNSAYPAFTQLILLPNRSVEQRQIRTLRIGSGGGGGNGILLVGGTHARELINPDLLAGLAFKLCWAYANGRGLTFGPKAWSAIDIRLIVDGMDVFVLPLLNPDGREYVASPTGYQWWRKNRSINPGGSRGTDLNRNYDFLWQWTIGNTSSVPTVDTYRGGVAFSEPETQNVRWLLDSYPNIGCFADVHSYSELILYPWGDDNNQTTDPSQNFLNPAWDGLRGTTGTGYAEYIPAADQTRFVSMGTKLRDGIAAVRGRTYTVQQGVDLYPTSGVSADYGYSRFFLPGGGRRKVCGYVIETNRLGPGGDWQYGFQPPYGDAIQVMEEVQSGLIQFMLSCLCVVREVGRSVLSVEALEALGGFRDVELMETARGRRWVDLLDANGEELLALVRADRRTGEAAERILADAAEVVLGRDRDEPPRIDRALADRMERMTGRLEKKASPQLRKALTQVRREVRRVVDKTARQAIR